MSWALDSSPESGKKGLTDAFLLCGNRVVSTPLTPAHIPMSGFVLGSPSHSGSPLRPPLSEGSLGSSHRAGQASPGCEASRLYFQGSR